MGLCTTEPPIQKYLKSDDEGVKDEAVKDEQNLSSSDEKNTKNVTPKKKSKPSPESNGGCKIMPRLRPKKDEDDAVPVGLDMGNLQVWSWNINGIRAVIKKNRI